MKTLAVLLVLFGACSLVHFVHNAEFVADYPNMPAGWSRSGVYGAWLAMTATGLAGWFALERGYRRIGLALLAAYAALGLDSLGHYVIAPLSAHTLAMNATILLEVTAAALVLVEVARQLVRRRA
jgi:hypothetical protein